MSFSIPQMVRIRQAFKADHIEEIEHTTREQILSLGIRLTPGARVAIAVGSRGIANLHRIVKSTVDTIRELGGNPFIIPAMGSHGGATAEGQRQVLEGYGVTEEYVGAEIRSSMKVVTLPSGNLGHKVYMDQYAHEADATVVINRVKVHTDFHGSTESGLLKICVIGLGKHAMALEIHRYGVYGLKELIPIAARHILGHSNIIMGIGIVENAYDQTAIIRAIRAEDLEREELKLLDFNRKNMPCLPVDRLDVLVVDQMGKDISGVGMDPNITGRMLIRGQQEPLRPDISNIIALELSETSHGNALGMGLADFITRRFFKQIDFETTYENVMTSTFTERGKMPIVAENARQAMMYALRASGPIDIPDARIIRIKNTLKLDEMYVSAAVLREIGLDTGSGTEGDAQGIHQLDEVHAPGVIGESKGIQVIGEMQEMFDGNGNIAPF